MTPQTFLLAKRTVFPRSAAQKIYKRFNFNSNDYNIKQTNENENSKH